ncbi:MAG: hypothetical protein JNM60_00565 [Candidatus Competibacteraceae bacterium]|nr:hypothetical protein [Candidatus Competibacteraceae bacterium]
MIFLLALIWVAACLPIVLFSVFDVNEELRFNYSLMAQIVAPFVAALCCYYSASRFSRLDSIDKMWILMGTGLLCWGVGAILYALYPMLNDGRETPFPWYSDIGYLLFVPFVLAALSVFKKSANTELPLFAKLGGIIFFSVALALSVYFNLTRLTEANSTASYIAILCYVLGDPLILASTMMTMSVLTGDSVRRWWLILIGLISYYLGDLVYNYLSLLGEYSTGNPIDITWPLGFGFIAVAALMTSLENKRA